MTKLLLIILLPLYVSSGYAETDVETNARLAKITTELMSGVYHIKCKLIQDKIDDSVVEETTSTGRLTTRNAHERQYGSYITYHFECSDTPHPKEER